jgi:hypothetical protein
MVSSVDCEQAYQQLLPLQGLRVNADMPLV